MATLAPSADYAGVFLADLKLTTFQPFTTQQENLRRAIDRVAGTAPSNLSPEAERSLDADPGGLDPSVPVTAGAEYADNYVSVADREHRLANMPPEQKRLAELELRMEQSLGQFMAESESQASLAGLQSVVDAMGALARQKNDPLLHRRPPDHEPSEAALRHADRPGESRQYRRLPGRRCRCASTARRPSWAERDLGRCTGRR